MRFFSWPSTSVHRDEGRSEALRTLGCHLFGAHSADIVQEIAAHSA